jgi:ABC-2 type transport system permease protein
VTADLAVAAGTTRQRVPRAVVARYSARRSLRSGVLWGYVFGVTVASSALSYSRIYATGAERRRLAETFGSNHATSALFGPAPQLGTAPGFTAFKVSMTLMVVGAVWGLLTGTRLLRGDEDAGRWELLVTGRATRGGAVAQVLAGLGAAAVALWAVTAVLSVVVGRWSTVGIPAPGALYLALALVAPAAMFLAVGALTSQLAGTRRRAAGYAAAVLAVAYGLRMVGDAGTGAHWLVWLSPLGWVEELRPLTAPQPWPLAPIAALTAAAAVAAVVAAGRRDVGSGLLPERSARPPRLLGLSGPTALSVRLSGPAVAWWAAGVAVAGLLMGIVARSAGSTVVGSSVQQVFTRLGSPGTGAAAFLGIAFLVVAVVLALQAVSQVAAAGDEEAQGRLHHPSPVPWAVADGSPAGSRWPWWRSRAAASPVGWRRGWGPSPRAPAPAPARCWRPGRTPCPRPSWSWAPASWPSASGPGGRSPWPTRSSGGRRS